MTPELLENFKQELKKLLNDYNVSIRFECDDFSDISSIYKERIEIVDNTLDEKVLVQSNGYYLTSNDL